MARPKKSVATAAKKTRKQYPPAFREEALKLAAVKGVAEAAQALKIQPALIYTAANEKAHRHPRRGRHRRAGSGR